MGSQIDFSLDSNRTASMVPEFYWDNDKGTYLSVKQLINPEVAESEADMNMLVRLKPDIKNHVRYRVEIFAKQLLFFYNTGEDVYADPKAKMKFGGVKGVTHHHNACHSSTLTGFISTKLHYFVHTWNATFLLPRIVNDIDLDLDQRSLGLRAQAAQILDEASHKEYNVEEGLKRFLKAAVYRTRTILLRKEQETTSRGKKIEQQVFILEIYLKVFEKIQKLLEKDSIYARFLLGIRPEEALNHDAIERTQQCMKDIVIVEKSVARFQDEVLSPIIAVSLPDMETKWGLFLEWATTQFFKKESTLTKLMTPIIDSNQTRRQRRLMLLLLTNSKVLCVVDKVCQKLIEEFNKKAVPLNRKIKIRIFEIKEIIDEKIEKLSLLLRACCLKSHNKADKAQELKAFEELFGKESTTGHPTNELPDGDSRGRYIYGMAISSKTDRDKLERFFDSNLDDMKSILYRLIYECSHRIAPAYAFQNAGQRYQFEIDHFDETGTLLEEINALREMQNRNIKVD